MSELPANVVQLAQPARPPPELEALLLGAIMDAEDPAALLDASGLGEGDFTDRRISLCWGLAMRLAPRKRDCDATSLWSAGKGVRLLEDRDHDWLLGLQSNNTLTASRFPDVAEQARRISRGRDLAASLRRLLQDLEQRGLRPGEMAGTLETLAYALARDHAPDTTGAQDLTEVIDAWHTVGDNPDARDLVVKTGIKILDEVMHGYVPGLNMLLGDPSVGKSALIASAIEAQVTHLGMRVGLFGLEEGTKWVSKRLLAKHVGVSVGDVARVKPTLEQSSRITTVAPALFDSLGRLITYPVRGITTDELVRRIADWTINRGVQCIYIDHVGEIQHRYREGQGPNWAVAETYRRVRDVAFRRGVPVVMLAHRKADPAIRMRKGPPMASDVGLTGEAEKMVRRMLGLWKQGTSLRATVIKNNEGEQDITVEFERLVTAALVDHEGGQKVNLDSERRKADAEAKMRKQEEKDATARYVRERTRKLKAEEDSLKAKDRAAAEAAAAGQAKPEETPQLGLLDVPPTTKQEPTS